MTEMLKIVGGAADVPMDTLDALLDTLCPMHVRVSETGHIQHAGPTLLKLRAGKPLLGQRFLEVFNLDRPRAINTMSELMERPRGKLHLKLHDGAKTELKGVLMRLPDGQGAIINLSFGIYVAEGVQAYNLTAADFAVTDLAIEMLYLVEAKSAAMAASRNLNERLQGAKQAAEEQALTDTLTGLRNRRAADETLIKLMQGPGGFSLMHVDLDFFKSVNDTLGHAAGDHVLQVVAQIMQSEVRQSDMIARVGGDEFMILFDRLTSPERLRDISHRLIKGMEKPIPFEEHVCKISASIGIAIRQPQQEMTVDELVQDSDRALYASKRNGRRQATIYDPKLHSDAMKTATG